MTKPEIIKQLAAFGIEASPRLLKAELEKLLTDAQARREDIKQARLAEGLAVAVRMDHAALERIERERRVAALCTKHLCREATGLKIYHLMQAGRVEAEAVRLVEIMYDRGCTVAAAQHVLAREAESRRIREAQRARRREFSEIVSTHRTVSLADLQQHLRGIQ